MSARVSSFFVILGLPGWWVHGLFDSSFFLASENFLQREQSRRVVVCFLVGHGMRTHFRVLTERGRRGLARPTGIYTGGGRNMRGPIFFGDPAEGRIAKKWSGRVGRGRESYRAKRGWAEKPKN